MDEMDLIQDMVLARQEAALVSVRERMNAERSIIPPAARECDECGCDIPAGRLKARPLTRLCVDCQTEAERPPR